MNKLSSFSQAKATSSSVQQKSKQPVAPPVYRPQPTPRVLQRKTAVEPQLPAGQTKPPAAPPVYRPQAVPKVLQSKKALPGKSLRVEAKAESLQERIARTLPTPPAPCPRPVPKVLQAKKAETRGQSLPPLRGTNAPRTRPASSPSPAKSSAIQRMESTGPKVDVTQLPDWAQKDLATRFETYIVPLEKLAESLINEKLIHVNESLSDEENVRRLMGLFETVHDTRSRLQDQTRSKLSPEGLAFSQNEREGHKDGWTILIEAISKHFAENGILKRDLTQHEIYFLLQSMIHGATRTRPSLRQQAEDAHTLERFKFYTQSKL